jgi:LytS/YehU family sensor histidine kinase
MVDGGIVRLESRVQSGNLEVSVENDFDPEAPTPRRSGLGLRNVRNRLETRFGAGGRLSTGARNNRFRAEMVFPCQRGD